MTAATLAIAVSWVPAYLGTVLADRRWVPVDLPRALIALLVLGPLVWAAVLAQNDLHDLPSDRANPRKATSPLVTGAIDHRTLRRWYRWSALASVVAAWFNGPLFVLGVAGVLVLGWAYSAPPLRLKTRPGWDVAVNALVVGVVSPAAGWSISREHAAADVIVPRSTPTGQLLTVPVLLTAYAILTRRPTIPRLAVLSLFFAVPTAGFALAIVN